MTVQTIEPADGRGEVRGVAILVGVIVALWIMGVGLRARGPGETALASHQRSAFATLDAREQGLFNDLRAAEPEIRALYKELQAWPEPALLAEQSVPPFARDAAWMQRGKHAWQRLDAHSPTHAVYWGKNDNEEWALVLSGETATVWRRAAKPDGAIPQAIPEMLVLDSWVEFIARKAKSS